MNEFLGILFRWLHIIPACLTIGGLFFLRFILPVGLSVLPPDQEKAVFLRCRRVFKFVVHPSILLFLISGAFNAMKNWSIYHQAIPMSHALFGLHVLMALVFFAIALIMLAGKEPPAMHKQWMMVNFVLLLLAVAAASSLKWVRDHTASGATPSVHVR